MHYTAHSGPFLSEQDRCSTPGTAWNSSMLLLHQLRYNRYHTTSSMIRFSPLHLLQQTIWLPRSCSLTSARQPPTADPTPRADPGLHQAPSRAQCDNRTGPRMPSSDTHMLHAEGRADFVCSCFKWSLGNVERITSQCFMRRPGACGLHGVGLWSCSRDICVRGL